LPITDLEGNLRNLQPCPGRRTVRAAVALFISPSVSKALPKPEWIYKGGKRNFVQNHATFV